MPASAIPNRFLVALAQYGLVSIPTRLLPAVSAKEIPFQMLHAKDDGRVYQQWICEKNHAVVLRDEMVKPRRAIPARHRPPVKPALRQRRGRAGKLRTRQA